MINRKKIFSSLFLPLCVLLVTLYFITLHFSASTLYESDGYFHVAVARIIKDNGVKHDFSWNQFSTFRDSYSDNDFFLHFSIIPFLFFTDNPVLSAKYAAIFYNIIFLILFCLILKKYLSKLLVFCFFLLLVMQSSFSFYFLLLRGATLVNIFIILGVYFLIYKKWKSLFFLSLFFPFVHLSFFVMVIFSIIGEILRYAYKREFYWRNILVCLIASLIGFCAHPNFPNNLVNFHLNVILLPYYYLTNSGFVPAVELGSSAARFILINNFTLFVSFFVFVWLVLFYKVKIAFSTIVWWSVTSIYLLCAFFSDRFWYQANVLFFIFFASFVRDWQLSREPGNNPIRIHKALVIYAVSIAAFFPSNINTLTKSLNNYVAYNEHYEKVAAWMNKNIPQGVNIYHANVSDSSYFICLNSKNKYIVSCDPVYMFYWSIEHYRIYRDLKDGKFSDPAFVIRKIFNAQYGYTRKSNLLGAQIKKDPAHFKILYEDSRGIVFHIL